MNLIEELRWRGLISDIMPGTEEHLLKEKTRGYVGFDPTADSLHIGSLVPIILLVHMQRAGHIPYALIGGATGMIGDPTGKSEERNLLDEEALAKNSAGIQKQLSKFIDFESSAENKAVLVNNYDWFRGIGFIDFLRDVGKHITVNYMMAKESVKKRIEGDTGISYTEFAYQLMQGFDFYHLYKTENVKLQFGGSDQWGNITTGNELIRRLTAGEGEAFAFTCPLIKKADGGKFGKTEKGNVWLDPARTSPYQFYQFWLNSSDEDVKTWLPIFTFLTKNEIDAILREHEENPHLRIAQNRLASELTRFVHSEEALDFAQKATAILFGQATREALMSLNVEQFEEIMEGISRHQLGKERWSENPDWVSVLAESGIFKSKGEARKMLQGGGVSVNKDKVGNVDATCEGCELLHDKYILVQKGRKNYFLLEIS